MKNQLKLKTEEGKDIYAYLYNGYYERPVVSFQYRDKPFWSPNPYCYDFETFLGIEEGRGLMIDGDRFSPKSINGEAVQKVKEFIKNYKGEYLKSYLRSEVE